MRISLPPKIKAYYHLANQWLSSTASRALEQAYSAALGIRDIENEYFNGDKISPNSSICNNVFAYFQTSLNKHLQIIQLRLLEFKVTNSILPESITHIKKITSHQSFHDSNKVYPHEETNHKSLNVLEQLAFIDEVVSRYKDKSSITLAETDTLKADSNLKTDIQKLPATNSVVRRKFLLNESSVLPRSIFRTARRIGRDLDPNSETQIIQEFQKSQTRTRIALRFIILLAIVPLLTQQLSKTFVFSPIVNHLQRANKIEIFLNYQQEEELFKEIDFFEKRISFEKLINEGSAPSQEEINNSIKEKSLELAKEYKAKSVDAIANIFADIGSLISFAFVVASSQREIKVLKSFLDEIIYGLSDSAKAFIIILSTDIFVGFHSTHGWEVLLEGILQHFGLPENRDLIYLFIATFPVILDAIFKYWIFRYLSRISPSAVATYRSMNE